MVQGLIEAALPVSEEIKTNVLEPGGFDRLVQSFSARRIEGAFDVRGLQFNAGEIVVDPDPKLTEAHIAQGILRPFHLFQFFRRNFHAVGEA